MVEETPSGACATCTNSFTICHSCGSTIKGEYIEISGIGAFCKDCYNSRNKCDVCGAPLTDQYWKLSDNRLTCGYCYKTAVYDPRDASMIYEELKSIINEYLGLQLNIPTSMALVDRNQLADIINKQSQLQTNSNGNGNEHLDPQKTLGIYTRRGIRRGIYIQTGLPRTLLIQIAAHEFAHAWQAENCPLISEQLLHEGFAEWVSYRILGYYGYTQQQNQMIQRTDIYGRGLNWALQVEAQSGIEGVINTCLNPKQAANIS